MQASLIESPGLIPTLSGYDNIKLMAALRHISKSRLDEMISFTNLGEKIHVQTGKYSMGMKQRLALAIALLSKPKFLILDEPTNGLDPRGIIELRNILKDLVNNEHISILFSSHQLGEIEELCDRIICINKGEIIKTPDVLNERYAYHLQLTDSVGLLDLLHTLEGIVTINCIDENNYKIVLSNETYLTPILKSILNNGYEVVDITKETYDIESIYQEVYGGSL